MRGARPLVVSPTGSATLPRKSAVLRIDVDRERARFGVWYELFPRSWGGFRGVAKVLPELAALGVDVVYLPPVHPIGETFRKGRNNAERAKKGDPGSPWAIGAADGGHDALHADLGSDEDFGAMVAAAREAGSRSRSTSRSSAPRPSLAEGAPGVVQPPPRRDDQVRREPAQALPGHPQRRLGLRGARAALAGASRRRARLVRPRGPRLPRRQPAHQADAVLGVADRRGAQSVPGGDLPRRGVHAPGADDDAREDRLLAVLYVLHVEEHEGGARRVRPSRCARGRPTTGRTCGRTRRTSCTSTCSKAVARPSRRGSCWRRRCRRATGSTPATRHWSTPAASGERGVPQLGEVRGEAAHAERAAPAADPAAERRPPRPSGAAAVREPALARDPQRRSDRVRASGRATTS